MKPNTKHRKCQYPLLLLFPLFLDQVDTQSQRTEPARLIPPFGNPLTRRPFVLHPLAPGQLASNLLGAAVPRLGRVAVLDSGLHSGDRVGLVLLARRGPRLGARDGADGALV